MAEAAAAFTVGEIEEFLIQEAALLDEWRLEEWLALMAPDARYLVPPLDVPDADHRDTDQRSERRFDIFGEWFHRRIIPEPNSCGAAPSRGAGGPC